MADNSLAIKLGDLRKILEQIGKEHDDKPVAVIVDASQKRSGIAYLSYCAAIQDDRILFEPA